MTTSETTAEAALLDIVDEVLFSGTMREAALGATWAELEASESQMLLIGNRISVEFRIVADAGDKRLFADGVALEQVCAEIERRMKAREEK